MICIRKTILYFAMAVGLCFSGWGFAADARPYFQHAVADAGSYGAAGAKFDAEQAYAFSSQDSRLSIGASLTAESNGFRLSSLTAREVAEGMFGGSVQAKTVG